MFAGTGGQQIANFAIMLVLARNLGPAAFGLVGIATVFIDIFSLIGRAGLTEVLIQNQNASQQELSTGFWTSLCFGIFLGAASFFGAPWLARVFAEPGLDPVMKFLSISCVFNTLGTVHEALLRRSFGFKALALRNVTATIASGAVAIVLALNDFGAMSLVAQRIVATAWLVAALWFSVRWIPSFRFSMAVCRKQLRMGVAVAGSSLLGTGNQKIIDLLVGYFLGTTALGYLRIAWKGLDLLLNLCVVPASSVIFTSLSHLQNDAAALARAYQRMVQMTALLIYPVFLGAAVVAPELIALAFGPQWEPSVLLMQFLTLMAFFIPLAYYRNNILLAAGRADQVFFLSLVSFIVSLVVSLIAVQIGIEATALGNTIRVALVTPVTLAVIQKYTGAKAMDTIKGSFPPAVAAVGMVGCLMLVRAAGAMPSWPVFSIGINVLLGAAIYAAILFIFFRGCWQEAARHVPGRFISFRRKGGKQ